MHAQYFAPVNLNPKLQLCAIIVAPSFWFSLSGPALFLLRHVASPSFWPQPRPLSSRHVKWNLQPAILLSQSLLIRKSHGMNYCKIHSLLSWALQKYLHHKYLPCAVILNFSPGLVQAWEKCELIVFGRVLSQGRPALLRQGGVGWLLLSRFNQRG